MKNFVQSGDVLTLTAPTGGVVSGVPVLIGALLVVPNISADQTKQFTGETKGVFDVAKVGSQAWNEGDLLYWDNTNKRFTKTSATGLFKAGVAAKAAGAGAGVVIGTVRFDGVALVAVA